MAQKQRDECNRERSGMKEKVGGGRDQGVAFWESRGSRKTQGFSKEVPESKRRKAVGWPH